MINPLAMNPTNAINPMPTAIQVPSNIPMFNISTSDNLDSTTHMVSFIIFSKVLSINQILYDLPTYLPAYLHKIFLTVHCNYGDLECHHKESKKYDQISLICKFVDVQRVKNVRVQLK